MYFIIGLTLFLVIYGIIEYRIHLRYLLGISIRIHVNGTRGKSSVTRLISAGLRAGGIHTVAKTTGTSPRMIYEDGAEAKIQRLGKANIKEQMPIIRHFSRRRPTALVIECMALQPHLQKITESMLVRSTIGVITNARPDHLDVMGPGVEDVALALAGTIPRNGILFTCEQLQAEIFKKITQKRNTHLRVITNDDVTDEEMHGFTYFEWKDNVALALSVCEHLGVNREVALNGMRHMQPDPGALRIYRIHFFGKTIEFANAFAANDPESTVLLCENLGVGSGDRRFSIFIVNCRADKIQRSEQLAELIATRLDGNFFILTGEYTRAVYDLAVRMGQDEEKIIDLGGKKVQAIFEEVMELAHTRTIVVGIGNIVGLGEEIVRYFSSRGEDEGLEHILSTRHDHQITIW